MQQQSLTKYALYLKEKANIELIEWEHSFISYEIKNYTCFIHDLWVHPDHRGKKISWQMADEVEKVAKENGCDKIMSSLMTNSNFTNTALINQLAYGFRIAGSDFEKLFLIKEI